MWIYLMIAFAVAMLVGPIMLMQPTQRQRYLAELRAKAQSLGVHVSSSQVETGEGGSCWFYYVSCEPTQELAPIALERENYKHDYHIAEIWSVQGEKGKHASDAALKALLQELPDSVYGVSVKEELVGVHWSEKGGEAQLYALHRLLTDYMASSAKRKKEISTDTVSQPHDEQPL